MTDAEKKQKMEKLHDLSMVAMRTGRAVRAYTGIDDLDEIADDELLQAIIDLTCSLIMTARNAYGVDERMVADFAVSVCKTATDVLDDLEQSGCMQEFVEKVQVEELLHSMGVSEIVPDPDAA